MMEVTVKNKNGKVHQRKQLIAASFQIHYSDLFGKDIMPFVIYANKRLKAIVVTHKPASKTQLE